MSIWFNLLILAGALTLDMLVGYPDWLFRAIRHPVMWIGWLIAQLDRRWNRDRRWHGVLALAVIVAAPTLAGCVIQTGLARLPFGWMALAVLASSLLAQRSLHDHVAPVAAALEADDLTLARQRVAMIVGRDPATLDCHGVARAAIESLAENFSDGVVAPALWCALGGLPGLLAYKAVNTADSMIGHRTLRYLRFGWAAARLDDLLNLPASRLSALWLVWGAWLSGQDWRMALHTVWRDASKHRSPNAGWPEAAMAGALSIQLAGPRTYQGQCVNSDWIGKGRQNVCAHDLKNALVIYRYACQFQSFLVYGICIINIIVIYNKI